VEAVLFCYGFHRIGNSGWFEHGVTRARLRLLHGVWTAKGTAVERVCADHLEAICLASNMTPWALGMIGAGAGPAGP
jgi:hypothetical protein